MQFLPFLIVIAVVAMFIISGRKNQKIWEKQPTLEEYIKSNPDCQTKTGIRCFNCNSGSIKNWGIGSKISKRRVFICNQCGTTLYRAIQDV